MQDTHFPTENFLKLLEHTVKSFFFSPKVNLFDVLVFAVLLPLVVWLLGGGVMAWATAFVVAILCLVVSVRTERTL